jgi:hypothetical protein
VAGNESEFNFEISGSSSELSQHSQDIPEVQTMKYHQVNSFERDLVSVVIPKNALYQDLDFTFDSSPPEQGSLTDFYHISSEEVPLHTPYTLSIRSEGVDPVLRNKLLIVTLDEEGKIDEAGGKYSDGKVSSRLKYFGKFAIGIDTIPPRIIPTGGAMPRDMSGKNRMKFLITDELSGIEKYEGYIDDKWVLFEYDMKNDLLFHEFDADKITANSAHELELYVTDSKGNASLYRSSFNW